MNKSKSSLIFEYFVDILIMKATFKNLLINMKLVFEKLRKYDLKCKPISVSLVTSKIKLLSNNLLKKGVKPGFDKVSVFKKLKPPTTLKQLQSQLECYNYFSKRIKIFAYTATLLYQKIKKKILNLNLKQKILKKLEAITHLFNWKLLVNSF